MTTTSPQPAEPDTEQPAALAAGSAHMRHGGWLSWRGVRLAIKAGIASMVLHALFVLVILLLNLFDTNVDMEVAWSDDPIQGIGDVSEVAETTFAPPVQMPPALTAGNDDDQARGEAPEEPPPETPEPVAEPEPEPEPEPVAEPEPDPEPEPEPEPEPDLRAESMAIPAPELPDDVVADAPAVDPQPEPEPETAEVEPDPEPETPFEVPDPDAPVETAEADEPDPQPEPEDDAPFEVPDPDAPTDTAEAPVSPAPDDAPAAERARNLAGALLEGAVKAGAPVHGESNRRGHVAEALPGLDTLGPGNARLVVLIRSDRFRGTTFEDSVRGLLQQFPHYQASLGKSGIDPINSLDAVLVATPNPLSYQDTFLAARHAIPDEEFQAAVSASYPVSVEWGEHKGRPIARPVDQHDPKQKWGSMFNQVVYLSEPGMALYMRPSLLATLDEVPALDPEADAEPQPEAVDIDGDGTPDPVEQRTLREMVATIGQIDAAPGFEPAVFMTVKGIESLRFRNLPQLPAPLAMAGGITPGPDTTRLTLRLEFADEATAESFEQAWPQFVEAVGDLPIPGLKGLAAAMQLERDGTRIYADGQLNSMMVKLLLTFATSSLPEVQAPQ